MTMTVSQCFDELKAELAEGYQQSHGGSLVGFSEHFTEIEPNILIAAKERACRVNAESTKAAEQASERTRVPVTITEKAEYVAKFGGDAYQELMTAHWNNQAGRR